MKESSRIRSSHVNSGTSFNREELGATPQRGREFRHPKLQISLEPSETTSRAGLALAVGILRSLRIPSIIDNSLQLLKGHRPFRESDHVLTHVYNLFLGGTCIEDIAELQCSEPLKRVLGASRVPDPTTAGDFLRRFDSESLQVLDAAIDQGQEEVWRRAHGRRKQKMAIVDLDSHIHKIYGNQKEGADFAYNGSYGYHPLLLTLSNTQEILRIENRPGNVISAEGAVDKMEEVTPLLERRFRQVLWRGDSAFARQEIYDFCEENEHLFCL